MRVRVLLFGVLKDRVGGAERVLELAGEATVADVMAWAGGLLGDDGMIRAVAVAVNREYARPETRLQEGDEVALLPPVSGGGGECGFGPGHVQCGSRLSPGHV